MRKIILIFLCFLLTGCLIDQQDFEKPPETALATPLTPAISTVLNVIYPNVNGQGEEAFGYKLLRLALEKSGESFDLSLNSTEVNNERIREMIINKKVTIADFGTTKEYEDTLLPIYIPIDMGLNGWRVCVVNNESEAEFSQVQSVDDMQEYILGQVYGWTDADILLHNEMDVLETLSLESAFKMLESNRLDVIPLGINEVNELLNRHYDGDSLMINKQIIIKYPMARLFFLNKEDEVLHDVIYNGLRIAYNDGSFMALFEKEMSYGILKDNLEDMTVIELDNPFLSESYKKIPERYFYKNE